MTQKTLFEEEEHRAKEEPAYKDDETDIKVGIEIAEAEMGHEILAAFKKAPTNKKAKAKKLLQEIATLSLQKGEDAELDTFAKVLTLEKVLGTA